MNQEKIVNNDFHYKEINEIFNFLKSFIRNNSNDNSKLGLAGWADEEFRKCHNLIFKINDGGYSSTIISLKYKFNLMSSYQNDIGSYFLFWEGDFYSLLKCFEDISEKNDIDNTIIH